MLAGAMTLFQGCDSSGGGSASTAGAPGSGGVTGAGGAETGGSPAETGGTTTAGNSSGGGVTTSGGAITSGGAVVTGGTTRTGGTVASGGTIASGGTVTSGGAVASGGTVLMGGTTSAAGATATGGATASGGTTSTGGTKPAGGTATGGASSTGGSKATAGTTATGGTIATGGITAAGGASASGGSTGPLSALTIYIAGDSTVSTYADTAATNDQAGWGQMLHEIFNDKVTVQNRAAGGRTAYWFYLEGAVDKILSTIKPGDYFFIQFGTNDQNTGATFVVNGTTYQRYADAQTTFKTQLKQYYLDPTKAKGAIPVLVTPPPRNSAYCNGGNGLAAYDTAMIELGAAENVAVIDLGGMTHTYLAAICPKPTSAASETFFKNTGGTVDGTHFQEGGARKMAGFIGDAIRTLKLGLAAYLL
jgi:lysophospholipase L1-like esterase